MTPNVIDYHLPFGGGYQTPNRIILHAMGEYIVDANAVRWPADRWLEHLRLSAHAIVFPNGDIVRLREDNEIGYHAKGHNTDTLGIEFAVKGEYDGIEMLEERIKTPYLTDDQYNAGLWQVREWMGKFDIGIEDITTHQKLSPERKSDPGEGFPELFYYDL